MPARWSATLAGLALLAVPATLAATPEPTAGAVPAAEPTTTSTLAPPPEPGTPPTSTTTTTTTAEPGQPADAGQQTAGITVTGEGRASAAPDLVRLALGVRVTAATVETARAQAAASAQAVIRALQRAGVAAEDMQTSTFDIQPQYESAPDGSRRLTGYVVTNALDVRIRDLAAAGQIIDSAVAAGGDDVIVDGVAFDLQDRTALESQARQDAWRSAQAKAAQLAQLAGVTLGPVLNISETTTSPPTPVATSRAAGPTTPIQPGRVEATVQLTVRWALVTIGAPAQPTQPNP